MRARSLGLAAAALLAGACERGPAQPAAPASRAAAEAKVRLVAPVSRELAATPTASASASAAALGPAAETTASAGPAPAATAASGATPQAPGKQLASYPPKDECAALPGFAAFRDKLATAIRKRDAAALAALADPAVRLDFGGGAGRDELRGRLTATRPELWRELQELLPLGCAADGDLATMPWIFSRMPEAADPYRALLVTGDKVPVRQRPAATAPVVGELSWAVVTRVADAVDAKARFVEVATTDRSLRGFVEAASLRGLLDYRVVAEPQAGGWAITAFLAGD